MNSAVRILMEESGQTHGQEVRERQLFLATNVAESDRKSESV